MPQQVEAPTKRLAEAIEIVAENAGWRARELLLILDYLRGTLLDFSWLPHSKITGKLSFGLPT